MARMTPKEATAVNVLLGYMVGKDEQPPKEVVLALETLASRAHNRLQTGWSESSVRDQWPYAYEGGGTSVESFVERIDRLGLHSGWRDRESEGRTRNQLLGLRANGGLDRGALLDEMRGRGHDESALKRLDRLIDETYKEPGPAASR